MDHSRRRLGTIPDEAWRDPYMIGFLAMLISLTAKIETGGRIAGDALGLAQLQAWADITGVRDDQIGQEICLLSSSQNVEFGEGCHNALRFLRIFSSGHDPANPDIPEMCKTASFQTAYVDELSPEHVRAFGNGGMLAAALWERYFEEKIH